MLINIEKHYEGLLQFSKQKKYKNDTEKLCPKYLM